MESPGALNLNLFNILVDDTKSTKLLTFPSAKQTLCKLLMTTSTWLTKLGWQAWLLLCPLKTYVSMLLWTCKHNDISIWHKRQLYPSEQLTWLPTRLFYIHLQAVALLKQLSSFITANLILLWQDSMWIVLLLWPKDPGQAVPVTFGQHLNIHLKL